MATSHRLLTAITAMLCLPNHVCLLPHNGSDVNPGLLPSNLSQGGHQYPVERLFLYDRGYKSRSLRLWSGKRNVHLYPCILLLESDGPWTLRQYRSATLLGRIHGHLHGHRRLRATHADRLDTADEEKQEDWSHGCLPPRWIVSTPCPQAATML